MLFICTAALIARVLILVEAWRGNPLVLVPIEDARVYWDWAAMIASGQLLYTTPFQSAPLYPYLLGLIRYLGGNLLSVYSIQIILHLATTVLIGKIAARRFGFKAGLMAALLFVLLTEPAFFTGRVLNSSLQLFLIAALWIQLITAHDHRTTRAWLAVGILAGLNCLANPTMLPVLIILGPWAFWQGAGGSRGIIRAVGTVVIALAFIAPATIHNYLVCGEFIPISAQAGLTFYLGNCPGAEGTYTKAHGISGDRQTQNLNARRIFKEATGREGSWKEVSSFYFKKGVAYWSSDLPNAFRLFFRKLYWFLTGRNYGDIYVPRLEMEAGLSDRSILTPLPTAWLVLPAIVALCFMLRRAKQYVPELILFGIPLLITCVFWYSPRYRLPAVPVIVVAAAWVLCQAVDYRKNRSRSLAVGISVLLAFGLGLINRTVGFDAVSSGRAIFEYNVGHAFAETENLNQAKERFEKALVLRPDYGPAQFGLGNVLREMGRQDEAIEYLKQALLTEPDNAGLSDGLSKNLREQGSLDEAIMYSRRAVQLEPDRAEFHNNLAIALAEKRETAEAIHHFHLAMEANPMLIETYLNLGMLYADIGRQEEALQCCAQAVRLDPNLAQAHALAGTILFERGQDELGLDALKSACEADPDNPIYPASLSWYLATRPAATPNNLALALHMAQNANRLARGRDFHVLDTLAIAYAANGRFDEAINTARSAIEMAEGRNEAELVSELRARLSLYEQGKPYKEVKQ